MATPNIDQISKELAFKIFDPVSGGASDGKIFTAELRMGYINRAFSNLVRIAETFEVDKTKIFKNYYQFINLGDQASAGADMDLSTLGGERNEFIDVYYNTTGSVDTDKMRADRLEVENYFPVLTGMNTHYTPLAGKQSYWCIVGDNLKLLPTDEQHYDVTVVARNSFDNYTQGGNSDIELPGEFKSLLVIMAAMEAMSDKGDAQKYNLYANALDRQIQIMGVKKQKQNSLAEEGKL